MPDAGVFALMGTIVATAAAAYSAYRSERKSIKAEASAKAAAETAKVDQARQEYITILEKNEELKTAQITDLLERVRKLEAAEEICQRERMTLLAENATLRRENDTLNGSGTARRRRREPREDA